MGYTHNMAEEKRWGSLIPTGWQEFKVLICSEEIESKKGNKMFVVTLEEFGTSNTIDLYLISERKKRWQLKSFLDACEVPHDAEGNYNWDINTVTDKIILGFVVHEQEEYIDRNNNKRKKTKARIEEFKAIKEIKEKEIPF